MKGFNIPGILAGVAKLTNKEEIENWGAEHNLKLLGITKTESGYYKAMFVGLPDSPTFEIDVRLANK